MGGPSRSTLAPVTALGSPCGCPPPGSSRPNPEPTRSSWSPTTPRWTHRGRRRAPAGTESRDVPDPHRRGRDRHLLLHHQGLARGRLRLDGGDHRGGGPRPRSGRGLPADGARHRPARHGRVHRAAAAACPRLHDPGHHPHRPHLGRRHGRGPGGRGGRLHAQTVPLRGAAGPDPAAAARPGQRRPGRHPAELRRPLAGPAYSARDGRRSGGGALRARVLTRRDVPVPSWPSAQPRAAARPGLGLRLRPRVQRRGRLRALPAQEARRGTDRHRARHGLPPGRRHPLSSPRPARRETAGSTAERARRHANGPAPVRCRAVDAGRGRTAGDPDQSAESAEAGLAGLGALSALAGEAGLGAESALCGLGGETGLGAESGLGGVFGLGGEAGLGGESGVAGEFALAGEFGLCVDWALTAVCALTVDWALTAVWAVTAEPALTDVGSVARASALTVAAWADASAAGASIPRPTCSVASSAVALMMPPPATATTPSAPVAIQVLRVFISSTPWETAVLDVSYSTRRR